MAGSKCTGTPDALASAMALDEADETLERWSAISTILHGAGDAGIAAGVAEGAGG